MVDQTQIYPSSISPLGLFQGIVERLKGGPWRPELLRGPKLEWGSDLKGGTSDPSSYHDISAIIFNTCIKFKEIYHIENMAS